MKKITIGCWIAFVRERNGIPVTEANICEEGNILNPIACRFEGNLKKDQEVVMFVISQSKKN